MDKKVDTYKSPTNGEILSKISEQELLFFYRASSIYVDILILDDFIRDGVFNGSYYEVEDRRDSLKLKLDKVFVEIENMLSLFLSMDNIYDLIKSHANNNHKNVPIASILMPMTMKKREDIISKYVSVFVEANNKIGGHIDYGQKAS